jgi:tRNA dimethylallyltransferase
MQSAAMASPTLRNALREPTDQPTVIVLLGPTASGKTDLGIAIARALDLTVLSVDSRQLYRGMDIGTAKPTAEQRSTVRHELLDLRDPDQPINLQDFRVEAERLIEAEHRRRGIALLVGGSGLYLKAITQGMRPPAVPPQPLLRAQLEALGQPLCHGLLRLADPPAAARIMPRDAVRTQRALEVIYATGQPLSSQQGTSAPPWRVLELGLNPPDLKSRISQRSSAMFAAGLVGETRGLVERYGDHCPLLDTIGYSEARAVLRGEIDEAEAIAHTGRRTHQFAKRQRTWFRRQHQPVWLGQAASGADPHADPLEEALSVIGRVLG